MSTTRRVQGLIVAVVGVAALRLGATGDLVFYVRERMRVPLLVGGVLLVVFGVATAWPRRPSGAGEDPHEHLPRSAWFLLVPVVLLLAFTPGPLGADAADGSSVYVPTAASEYPPLDRPRDGAIDMTLAELVERVRFDHHHDLTGVPVRVKAFVERGEEHGDALGRYLIACCAADAMILQTHVRSWPGAAPPAGQWVEAVVRVRSTAGDRDVVVDVDHLRPIDQPAEPYLTP